LGYIFRPFDNREIKTTVEMALQTSNLPLHPPEEALRASEERYRQIVETAEEGIWLVDQEWKTTFVNAKMGQLLDWPPGGMPERHFFDFMDEEGRQLALDKMALRERGARMSLEVKFIRRDGRELWTLLSLSPITDGAGHFTGALAMVTDITERKTLEGHLRPAQTVRTRVLARHHAQGA
jgi:PAS domain S-box-containing protein